MKKSLVFLLIFLFLPFVLAIETNLKEKYRPGETLIIEISGNFIEPLKPSDILFYSGRLYVPLIYDITKIQNTYYLYALLPEKERNYSLIIKNAHYIEAGQEIQKDLRFNFSVSGNLSFFSVNPGFIITDKNFDINVESKLNTIDIKTEFLNSTKEISVGTGQTKKIPFSISEIKNFTVTTITLSAEDTSYKIPVVIFPTEISEEPKTSSDLRFSKSIENFTVLKNSDFQFEVTLLNIGQEDINNISILTDLKDIITINPEKITKLFAGTSQKINLTINSNKEGIYNGTLSAYSGNYTAQSFITIITLEDKEELEEVIEESEITQEKTCSELGGLFCEEDEKCEGISRLTIDGLCCIGECKKEKSGAGKTIALLVIIVILALIGFLVFKKLKSKRKTQKEILKEKAEKYEERFKPKEVRGGLSRV